MSVLCCQVCWYWRYLTELDQLWMPKCLRLGWTLPFMPSQYEVGVWKRNYLENIKALQIMNPKVLCVSCPSATKLSAILF